MRSWKRSEVGEIIKVQMGMVESSPTLERSMGLLRVRVVRGINLPVRDFRSSDPYVVLKMGNQKLKTRVIKKNVNPEWHEDLTFSVSDPNLPVKLSVFDHDTFTPDDHMGDAEIDIKPLVDAANMNLEGIPDSVIIKKIIPDRKNCLAEESRIVWYNGKLVQYIMLRLKNAECGEIELQLQWIQLPRSGSS